MSKRKIHFELKNCFKCKRVWNYSWGNNTRRLEYYLDFPTYGLKKINCPNCKEVKYGITS